MGSKWFSAGLRFDWVYCSIGFTVRLGSQFERFRTHGAISGAISGVQWPLSNGWFKRFDCQA